MGRNRTSGGDQGSGADQGGGNRDPEKLSQDRMICRQIISGMLFFEIMLSIIFGVAASNLHWYFAIPVCILGGGVGVFFGMAIEWTRSSEANEKLKNQLLLLSTHIESETRKAVMRAIKDTRKEYVELAVESARAVANRAVNRILAKHAGRLMESEYREATLQEADQIVDEEIDAFQSAIKDEEEGK